MLRLPLLTLKILLATYIFYSAAVVFPQPAFVHHTRYGKDEIWSDEPVPAELAAVLDDAHRRLRRSPRYDEREGLRLFGTHAMTARVFGPLAGYRLPEWLTEGYADYVAKGPDFDLQTQRGLYRVGALNRPPRHYQRYQLEVDFMLHQEGRSLDQLFAAPLAEADVRRRLDAYLAAQPSPGAR